VPVASCMGLGADGELYNINADHMAAACAEYIHADRLIYLTDVAGVLDGSKVLKVVSTADAEDMIRQNKVSGGMILKLEACKRALSAVWPKCASSAARCPRGCWLRRTARGFPARASLRSFPQAPREWCSEIEFQKSKKAKKGCLFFRGVEVRPERRFAALDEHVQALRHDFHARARLLRVRSKRKKVSRFSGRHRRERARIFLSGPGENDPARGGPRGSRLESVPQSVSRAARGKAREVVRHGPRVFSPTAVPKPWKAR
jgi:hypothetical protein